MTESESVWGPALCDWDMFVMLVDEPAGEPVGCGRQLEGWIPCGYLANFVVSVVCRTCGPRTFPVCSEDLHLVFAGIAEDRQWASYCTEPSVQHEIVAITEVLQCST